MTQVQLINFIIDVRKEILLFPVSALLKKIFIFYQKQNHILFIVILNNFNLELKFTHLKRFYYLNLLISIKKIKIFHNTK